MSKMSEKFNLQIMFLNNVNSLNFVIVENIKISEKGGKLPFKLDKRVGHYF